jgi:hypothetical protein
MLPAACLLCFSATAAFAQQADETSRWRLDVSLGPRTGELPTFDAPVGDTFVVGSPGLISEDFKPTMFGGELSAAYDAGEGWEIEFGGGYWSGQDDVAAQPLFDNNAGYGLAATDLTGADGTLVGASELVGDSVRASVNASLLETRLRLARRIETDSMLLKPFVGLIHERSQQDYAASFRISEPAVNNLEIPYELSQEVDSSRFGGEAGIDVSIPVDSRWRLDAGAAFALYHQNTSLSGRDCLASGTFSPGFDCEDSTIPNYTRLNDSTAHDEDDRTAMRIKLEAGLSYLLSFGTIGVSGFAQYDSAVAGVDNPLLTQDQFLGADPTRDVPAQLTFADAWSYGGSIKLSIPLQ